MHDLVIRGGTIVDGSGAPRREGDVAIDGGRIAAVGAEVGRGRREIDARGLLVAPGWVDIHTHYDGQAMWDPWLTPSSWHGVTTVVMTNCGVGVAPVRPDRRAWILDLIEAVEDIPAAVLAEGMRGSWEHFPEYLDALDAVPRAVDVATQMSHVAVRVYVMGERGVRNAPATPDDIAGMAAIVRQGLAAGALGFSTSRTLFHQTLEREPVPGTFASTDELLGIAQVLGERAGGVVQVASDLIFEDAELAWMEAISLQTRRPVVFGLVQNNRDRVQWRRLLDATERSAARGARLVAQVAPRPPYQLLGLQGTLHPFSAHATYREMAALPLDERVRRLRDPSTRRRMLAERIDFEHPVLADDKSTWVRQSRGAMLWARAFHKLFPLGDPPDYEPIAGDSIAAIAARRGVTPDEVAYDLLLARDGREMLYVPISWYDFEAIREMLLHRHTVIGLGDAGAHCRSMCDAGMPTFLLTHWARDRRRGARIPLEHLVRRQTRDTAVLYGLNDRGLVGPGMKADLNLIDLDALALAPPELVFDLPAQGGRLVQHVRGYRVTIVGGTIVSENGESTGALPGKLVRGPQAAAAG